MPKPGWRPVAFLRRACRSASKPSRAGLEATGGSADSAAKGVVDDAVPGRAGGTPRPITVVQRGPRRASLPRDRPAAPSRVVLPPRVGPRTVPSVLLPAKRRWLRHEHRRQRTGVGTCSWSVTEPWIGPKPMPVPARQCPQRFGVPNPGLGADRRIGCRPPDWVPTPDCVPTPDWVPTAGSWRDFATARDDVCRHLDGAAVRWSSCRLPPGPRGGDRRERRL